jgi:hypothetical protein
LHEVHRLGAHGRQQHPLIGHRRYADQPEIRERLMQAGEYEAEIVILRAEVHDQQRGAALPDGGGDFILPGMDRQHRGQTIECVPYPRQAFRAPGQSQHDHRAGGLFKAGGGFYAH